MPTSTKEVWANKEGLETYEVQWQWGNTDPGFSAVLRVKNEAKSLPWSLPGILRSVASVVLVDNDSDDDTPEVARSIAKGMGLSDKLTVASYPFEVSRCGPEHLHTHPESVHSLVYYYNWSFSHVDTNYALKWDGDMVLSREGEKVLRDLEWQLAGVEAVVNIPRSAVYIQSESRAYVDVARAPGELFAWTNSPAHTFVKCFDWETVMPFANHFWQLPKWVCFELKWLDENQFYNWSHEMFQEGRHYRKLREWQITYALINGEDEPEGVVQVDAPDGVHIIEHLYEQYRAVRSGA